MSTTQQTPSLRRQGSVFFNSLLAQIELIHVHTKTSTSPVAAGACFIIGM
jgi:hypothetical protein